MLPNNSLRIVDVKPVYLDYNEQTDLLEVSCRGTRRISELSDRLTHDWTMSIDSGRIKISNNDDYEQYLDYDISNKDVYALSFAFDQSMNLNYAVTYRDKNTNRTKSAFVSYDIASRAYVTREYDDYRQLYVILDDRRQSQSHISDVVLIGIRSSDNMVVLRNQRERYQQEYPTVRVNEKDVIIKAGMTKSFTVMVTLRRYIKTIHYQAFLGYDGVPITLSNGDPIWSVKQ